MIGLILKDFLTIKKTLIYMVVVLLIFGGVYSSLDNSYFVAFFISIMMVSIVISTMSYDEFYHWERYAVTLPLSRRQIVGAKYISALLLFVLGTGIALAVGVTVPTLHGRFVELVDIVFICCAPMLGIVGTAVVIPCYYRFGVQESRIVMMALYGVPSLLLVIVLKIAPELFENVTGIHIHPVALVAGIAAVVLAALAASFFVSVRIVERKEFK